MRQLYTTMLIAFVWGCGVPQPGEFNFPQPVDTHDRPIEVQERKTWEAGGVFADTRFDGARLSDFTQLDDTTWQATIRPENFPINMSPWYAFRLWSDSLRPMFLRLHYEQGRHRYHPKLSLDAWYWIPLDSAAIEPVDSTDVLLQLLVGPDTLWVAAQELETSQRVLRWCERMALHPAVELGSAGQSRLGRDLPMLTISEGENANKELVVILSRQHPPEVSGYYAMQAFVERLLGNDPLARSFRQRYRLLVFPLMNPDGVDLGHWRHNVGGIDLNRDWAFYRQAETRQVASRIVAEAWSLRMPVVLGIDFHSTWRDLYYTFDSSLVSVVPHFKDYWLQGIDEALLDYRPDDRPSGLNEPISKTWFWLQFGAESITYEVGDHTPRPFIRHKAKIAATEMMELLIFRTPLPNRRNRILKKH